MNKETTIFIDTQDMEERYGEQLYQEYLEKENKELKEKVNQLETNRDEAIELSKEVLNYGDYKDEMYEWIDREYLKEILSILERGKE